MTNFYRRALPEAGAGNTGGAGLVSGSAGNAADQALCQRDGIQQGKTAFDPVTASLSPSFRDKGLTQKYDPIM